MVCHKIDHDNPGLLSRLLDWGNCIVLTSHRKMNHNNPTSLKLSIA
jgi:hypothetical protein